MDTNEILYNIFLCLRWCYAIKGHYDVHAIEILTIYNILIYEIWYVIKEECDVHANEILIYYYVWWWYYKRCACKWNYSYEINILCLRWRYVVKG